MKMMIYEDYSSFYTMLILLHLCKSFLYRMATGFTRTHGTAHLFKSKVPKMDFMIWYEMWYETMTGKINYINSLLLFSILCF